MNTREQLNDRLNQVGKDVRDLGRDVWLAGLGAVGTLDERGRAVFSDLVDRGEKMDGKVDFEILKPIENAAGRVKTFGKRLERRFEGGLETTVRRLGMPAHGDVAALIDRVERLSKKVDGLSAR